MTLLKVFAAVFIVGKYRVAYIYYSCLYSLTIYTVTFPCFDLLRNKSSRCGILSRSRIYRVGLSLYINSINLRCVISKSHVNSQMILQDCLQSHTVDHS